MTSLQLYKTYSFRNKDPIIDKLRTICDDGNFGYQEISDTCGVSTTTLYNWWYGKTRRPQYASTLAVARAMGYDYDLVPIRGYKRKQGRIGRRRKGK